MVCVKSESDLISLLDHQNQKLVFSLYLLKSSYYISTGILHEGNGNADTTLTVKVCVVIMKSVIIGLIMSY